MNDLEKILHGYRLTTVEILYHMPDHPDILQSFIWQEYDIAPVYPRLKKFLDFWSHNIEGALHSIYLMAGGEKVKPAEFRIADLCLTLQ